MKYTLWLPAAALMAAGLVIAQAPAPVTGGGQAKGKGQLKGPAPDAAQSPASRPVAKTSTQQTYPAAQIKTGEGRFAAQCGFCHGRDTTGGESDSDLSRSDLVTEDVRGDKLGPFLRTGRPDQGMPAFTLSNTDLDAIVAYIHSQKTKFETVGGGRRSVEVADVATGDAAAGMRYFATSCASCHPDGSLAGIATRFQGLALLQRMLTPTSGRPAPAPAKVTYTLASGETKTASLAAEDEFTLTILDPAGTRQAMPKNGLKYTISDPLSQHFELLGKYTDADMHNVLAFLTTLK